MLKTLVVIPAYNEALNIKKTVIDLKNNATIKKALPVCGRQGLGGRGVLYSPQCALRALTFC